MSDEKREIVLSLVVIAAMVGGILLGLLVFGGCFT